MLQLKTMIFLEVIKLYYFLVDTPNITSLKAVSGNITPENDSTTLRCQVDSNPKANITWVFLCRIKQNCRVITMYLTVILPFLQRVVNIMELTNVKQ